MHCAVHCDVFQENITAYLTIFFTSQSSSYPAFALRYSRPPSFCGRWKSCVLITRCILPTFSMLSRPIYKIPSRVSRLMLEETLNKSLFYGEPAQRCDVQPFQIKALVRFVSLRKYPILWNQRLLNAACACRTVASVRKIKRKFSARPSWAF